MNKDELGTTVELMSIVVLGLSIVYIITKELSSLKLKARITLDY